MERKLALILMWYVTMATAEDKPSAQELTEMAHLFKYSPKDDFKETPNRKFEQMVVAERRLKVLSNIWEHVEKILMRPKFVPE